MSTRRNPIPPHAKMVFKGIIFEVWQWEQKMFDGSVQIFERLKRPNTATVIATVGDKILLLEQEQPDSVGAFTSLPGGRCDPGEEPLESAKRELLEETGYVSDDWTLWKETSPVGKIEWTIYTYIARNCEKKSEPRLDAGEKISERLIAFDEFLALADDTSFSERELTVDLLRTHTDASKKEEMRLQIFGT